MTPLQALKHAVLIRVIDEVDENTSPEQIDAIWEDQPRDAIWDMICEIRSSGQETGLPVDHSRHYEPFAVAALMPCGRWVGWTYWAGGGKGSNPEEINWMEDAYWVEAEVDQVLRLEHNFSRLQSVNMPSARYEAGTLEAFRDRIANMNAFCKPVPDASMKGMDVFAWFAEQMEMAKEMLAEGEAEDVLGFFQSGTMSGLVAQLFAAEFRKTPAKNYLELSYECDPIGEFTVTIQRKDGETAAKQLAIAKAEIERLEGIIALKTSGQQKG